MFLANSAVPVSFQLEQAAEIIEKSLRKKNWLKFEKGEIKLVLIPFYFFYYDAAFGEEGKPNRKTERGKLALNAETAELSKEIAAEIPAEEKLTKEYSKPYPITARNPLLSKKEAENVALLKVASMIGTTRENIVLSNFQLVYYPMWMAFVTVAEETYELDISAVSGKAFGEEKVPEREKGFIEITKETLIELKHPGAWMRYSKEIAAIGGTLAKNGIQKKAKLPAIMQNKMFWISIALLIILIAIVLYTR